MDEFASCILALYQDRSQQAEIARNIAKFNEHYNWTMVSAEYIALINRLTIR